MYIQISEPVLKLTGRPCANVYDITLGPGDVFVLHLQGNGLHKYGILGPGFEVLQTDFWVSVFVLRQIDVHHVPAVGTAAVLAVKLCDVLERAGEDTSMAF